MGLTELWPAACLAALITAVPCAARLFPVGEGLLIVRVDDRDPAAPLMAAARADAALVGVPAAGFAVLHGDAGKVRAAVGLAVSWKGEAPCVRRS